MAYEKRDNSGALGRNDKKTKSEQPDHKGNATINGVEYWISAWIKESAGGKFFSLSFTPKDESKASTPISAEERKKIEDDEIPF